MLSFTEITTDHLPHITRIVKQTGYRSCQLAAGELYTLAAEYATTLCFYN